MRICRSHRLPADCCGAVIAIGNFDGIHLGHQAVIGQALSLAHAMGAPLGVLSFEPHPRTFFRPAELPFRLTPFHPKARLLRGLGVEVMYVRRFDASLAALNAEAFAAGIVSGELAARAVVVGDDFRFGQGRAGNAGTLADVGRVNGYKVEVMAAVRNGEGTNYSSSTIRDHLRNGRPEVARALLGRWWEIEGHVRRGDQRGRTIGFPTANLGLRSYLVPAKGVYAVRVADARDETAVWRDGVANLGVRPTVDGTQTLLEVHLFDFDGDLYGRGLRVALVGYLRPERKFDGLAALTVQIGRDADRARALLAAAPAANQPA